MTADKIYPRAAAHIRAMAAFTVSVDLGGRADGTLAQNESAFPPSPRAIAAGQAAVAASRLDPDPDCAELRAALAEAYSVPAEEINCGAGSMDLIGSLIRALAGDGGTVLGTVYAYSFIAAAAAQAAMPYASVAERELSVDVDAVLAGVTAATRLVVVCNPGNPTGTRIDNREILRLGAALPAEVLLVVDQAYGEFNDQDPRPVFDLVRGGRAVVTRSLSKAYGLALAHGSGGTVSAGRRGRDAQGPARQQRRRRQPGDGRGCRARSGLYARDRRAHRRNTRPLSEPIDRRRLRGRVFSVLHLPGHSPGSLGLFDETDGLLFSGDALYEGELYDGLPDS